MSAEAQRIGHGDTDIRLLPLIDHKVQITGRIRMTIVDRLPAQSRSSLPVSK